MREDEKKICDDILRYGKILSDKEFECEGRFEKLKETHPKFYALLDLIKNNGMTYREAIDWVNEHGNLHIRY